MKKWKKAAFVLAVILILCGLALCTASLVLGIQTGTLHESIRKILEVERGIIPNIIQHR